MKVALKATRRAGAGEVLVVVPTGHSEAVREFASLADALYCAKVRPGYAFAVADAYEFWRDVAEEGLGRLVTGTGASRGGAPCAVYYPAGIQMDEQTDSRPEPDGPIVAIGGIGGSGTRVVAAILRGVGLHLGPDLNVALDNLWFTLLFKREEVLTADDSEIETLLGIFFDAMRGRRTENPVYRSLVMDLAARDRAQHPAGWLVERARTLLASPDPGGAWWGWKEPNTHVVIDRILPLAPNLRYIHVVRNGLDMAYSANKNQFETWGPHLIGRETEEPSPREALRFWCEAHRKFQGIAARMNTRAYLLRFDNLCSDPEREIVRLMRFLGLDLPFATMRKLAEIVVPPPTIGRFRVHGLAPFDPTDVQFVRTMGFDVRE